MLFLNIYAIMVERNYEVSDNNERNKFRKKYTLVPLSSFKK